MLMVVGSKMSCEGDHIELPTKRGHSSFKGEVSVPQRGSFFYHAVGFPTTSNVYRGKALK